MKKIVVLLMVCLVILAGCNTDNETSNPSQASNKSKDTELDLMLAQTRLEKKTLFLEKGIVMSSTEEFYQFPGQSQNIPTWEDEDYSFFYECSKAYVDYIKEKHGFDPVISQQCLDPRMNAIYDDSDKGVANGYNNEDIYLVEYETQDENVYSYLVVVRENDGTWHVIHEGLSYKKGE
ncbi:hypothetical protein F8154_00910 [Alkaliphilus pronyensis]|uniref:Lipoprotein n=1 Tax=Alkaliphilus pronyensis TaxID=1482732 RepID=A0A6I0FKU2_9FIRM|nr:hypothetical protein [Alkaliphilus pronyensis]KAB3539028.1 hypothetical protein F8154_00910 [Alkaliphilus pronyensis]